MSRLTNYIRKIHWPKKIRSQLIIGISVVHIVLMAVFVYDMVRREKNFLKNQNREQTLSLASNLAVNAEPYMVLHDYDGLERLVESHKRFPFLRYAMFISPEGLVVAHTDIKHVGLRLTDTISQQVLTVTKPQVLVENDDVLDMVVPVYGSNTIIGWSRVGMGQEYIQENLFNISRNGIIYILLALIVGAVFAIIFTGRLSKGLYRLIDTANRIKEGDRNFRSDVFDSYELDRLSEAFNQMLDEITSSNKMTDQLLENMPVGVWVLDKDGSIISANSEGKRIWSDVKYLSIDQFKEYKGWSTVTGKQLEAHEWGGARAILYGETSVNEEVEIEAFDGSHKIILHSAMPLLDEQGKILRAIVINLDITEKRKAERDLIKINQQIGERIKELNCLYKVSEIANRSDVTMHELLQSSVNLIPPAYQYPSITAARIVFDNKIYVSDGFRESAWVQYEPITKGSVLTGSVEVFYLEQMPDLDEGPFLKEERFLINSIADILGNAAEKKKQEMELRYSEEKFRGLVEQSLVGVFIVQGKYFRYVNPGLAAMSGYSKFELENNISFDQLVHEQDIPKVRSNYQRRLRGELTDQQYTFRIFNRNGDMRYVEAFVSRIVFNGEPAVLGTLVDITDRVEEEKRIGKAVTDAQERERMQIGMELHDNVQQIMVGILINVDFAKRKFDDKTIVESTLSNVSLYTNNALKELRRLSHQLAPSLSGSDSFGEKLTQLIHTMSKTDTVRFELDIDEALDIPEDIQVAFYRMIQEQLSNVFKYASASLVRIALWKHNEILWLQITDNGVGFIVSEVKRGIGLDNIARRAHVLGGEIQIISSPGAGCELLVEIPV